MDTAAVSLIAFAMVLWATFTAVGGIFDRNAAGIEAFEATRERLYADADTSIEVVGVVSIFGAGTTRVDVTVSNIGSHAFPAIELDQWEVFVDYIPAAGLERRIVRLIFAESLAANTWVARDIYLDHATTQDELINPGIVDPHEELVMRLQVSPFIKPDTEGRVLIYVPGVDHPLVALFTFA